jgi:hypothetical protein
MHPQDYRDSAREVALNMFDWRSYRRHSHAPRRESGSRSARNNAPTSLPNGAFFWSEIDHSVMAIQQPKPEFWHIGPVELLRIVAVELNGRTQMRKTTLFAFAPALIAPMRLFPPR